MEKKKQGFAVCPENINRNGRPPRGWTWADIFEEEVEKRNITDKKKIKRIMVNQMINKVVNEGDVSAFKEIANRMDGLPTQKIEGNLNLYKLNIVRDKEDDKE